MDRRDLFRTALALGLAAWATGCASSTTGGREVLGLDASTLAAAVNTTWQAMTGEEGVELDGANAIWAQRDHGWKQPYLDALTSHALPALLRAETAPVSVGLPKFEVRTEAALADALAAIGVRDAFDPDRADFSPMTDRERLHIGFVQHQAVVAIDEKGIEAAAATAIGMEAGGSAGPPKQLTCDRPFGYALVHLATATPLFVGVVADPSA